MIMEDFGKQPLFIDGRIPQEKYFSKLKVEDKKFWISEFLFLNTTVLAPLIYLLAKGSTN